MTFLHCSFLTSITGLSEAGVTSIESSAFHGSGLVSFDWPPTLEFVQTRVFDGCASLAKITGMDAVHTIETDAFKGTTSLQGPMYLASHPERSGDSCDSATYLCGHT